MAKSLEVEIILGGTFDPIHFGHLRIAQEMLNQFPSAKISLMPAAYPPHRAEPCASAKQRIAMLELALKDSPSLNIDTRELERTEPSYSVVTLQQIRAESRDKCLIFLMGTDAFAKFNEWYQWQELAELTNVLVVGRAGTKLPETGEVADFYQQHKLQSVAELSQFKSGKVAYCELPHLDISSSQIRALINSGKSPRFLLPSVILDYIETHHLYRQI